MENQNNENKAGLGKTILKIAKQVCAALNLSEESKINTFYEKLLKNLNREKTKHTKNLEVIRSSYHEKIELLDEQIEDATIRVEEAYRSVTIEDIATNEKMNQFVDKFWDNVEQAEMALENLTDQKKELLKELDTEVKKNANIIEEIEYRISKIES